MKTLRLAFSRIITYFFENKIIFVLYFIGTVACIFMMIFYYGNTLTYMTGNSKYDDRDLRRYEVMLSSPTEVTPETIEKLKNFEQEYNIQEIMLTTIVDADGKNIDFSSNDEAERYRENKERGSHEELGNDYIILSTFLNNNNDNVADSITGDEFEVLKSSIFSDDQLTKNVASAPPNENKDIKVGDITFNVVKNEDIYEYFIPSDAYFKSGIKTWYIIIWVSDEFSENMMYRYVDFLRDFFDIKYDPAVDCEGSYDFIRTPLIYYNGQSGEITSQFYSMAYIFILSIISFMFLLKYLMDSCRRENSILMMVGAKKKHIMLINFIENIILTLFSTVAAILLHAALYNVIFSKINLFENITYSIQDYLIIAMLSLGLSLIVQIPFIFTYWFKNIRTLKEGSK